MAETPMAALLINRGVLKIAGEEARDFLDRLLTASLAPVAPGVGVHAALLTPQGKIIADFFVTEADAEDGGGFYLDVPLVATAELVKRFTLYRLRAKIGIEDLSETLGVVALWGGPAVADLGLAFVDPRLAAMGQRVIAHRSQVDAVVEAAGATLVDASVWHAQRAVLGLGEPVLDYPLNDAFPHEINMDQLGGVDFAKGCYVGQEVVSRMQHRGTVRTRLVPVRLIDGFKVAEGAPVTAEDKPLGKLASNAAGFGVALLRLDRTADAVAAGHPITAGGLAAEIVKPGWWTAAWPLDRA
ncbi:MAG: YgfZ/GcvT domain-containing protein [Beijerinckiaceae bacterium]